MGTVAIFMVVEPLYKRGDGKEASERRKRR
jgi:hypothetical protein